MSPLELTKELVAFPSCSHLSNVAVTDCLERMLQGRGFHTERVDYRDEDGVAKSNVIGRLGPVATSAARGLAYFCHSDVVPADEWHGPGGDPFDAVEHEGRLYGRGSCDMKGSAACLLAAVDRIVETHAGSEYRGVASLGQSDWTAPLYFVCTADEERSYVGAHNVVSHSQLYREMVQAQTRALIGEPTLLSVVHAHKGICLLRITSHGESAHSATSEGCNANLAMIPFLQDLKSIYDESESDTAWQNAEFDPPTMSWNIGVNDHNAAVNVKAARSECTVFFRPLPGVDDTPLLARVEQAARNHGLVFEVLSRCASVYTAPDNPFVVEARSFSGDKLGATVSYGTDGGELVELHDKIVCGPGSIEQAHTADEWIDLLQLTKGTELFERFIWQWCRASEPGAK